MEPNTLHVGGPMFEASEQEIWKSLHRKEGAHYNTFGCSARLGMEGLREMFPEGVADELNFVLFSTSGVHGWYGTIEDCENPEIEEDEEFTPSVTFLIVHPRLVCLRYGNCEPKTSDDFAFLKKLRESSWRIVQEIGRHVEPTLS